MMIDALLLLRRVRVRRAAALSSGPNPTQILNYTTRHRNISCGRDSVRLFYNTKLHGNAYVGHPTYRMDARWDTRRRAIAADADRTQIHDFPKTQGSSVVAAKRPISQAVAGALAHCVVRSTAWTPLLLRRSGLFLDCLTRVLCGGSSDGPAALTELGQIICHATVPVSTAFSSGENTASGARACITSGGALQSAARIFARHGADSGGRPSRL